MLTLKTLRNCVEKHKGFVCENVCLLKSGDSKMIEITMKPRKNSKAKRPSNLTSRLCEKLKDLLDMNLRTIKAYLMKEDFQRFWNYIYPANAAKFLEQWCKRAMHSRIEPMQDMARSLRSHQKLLLNWFKAKKLYSSGVVEALNNKIKTTTKKSYGFRTYHVLEVQLYHTLGELPLPATTHRFC
jgi:transposase